MQTQLTISPELLERAEHGTNCSECGAYIKLYRRKLNSQMARWLFELYRLGGPDRNDVDVRAMYGQESAHKASSDGTYLIHWGLAEPCEHEEEDGQKYSGYWSITPKGVRFVQNKIRVPRRVHLIFNQVVGWSEEQTKMRSALGDHFNYDELMESAWI